MLAWFPSVWTHNVTVIAYWMIFSLNIKFKPKQKNLEELECAIGFVGKLSMRRSNEIYFVSFEPKMQEILKFKWFFC